MDEAIASLGDWRGEILARVRRMIHEVDPAITEEIKWRKPTNPLGVPTWSLNGILCTGESYKDKVKLTFFKGASLADPHDLFYPGQGGGTRRAIDIRQTDKLDEDAFRALVQDAIAANMT